MKQTLFIAITVLASFCSQAQKMSAKQKAKMMRDSIAKQATDSIAKHISDSTNAVAAALTEVYQPVPKMVTPGTTNTDAPSDAIVLFDGKNLDEWVSVKDSSKPAEWTVSDGMFTVDKTKGNIRTKRVFMDYQLHLEWKEPKVLSGSGQLRGNSGLFLSSIGPGDDGYELQILDSYNNPTYVNGQAGSVYKQTAPLVNATKPNDQWQTYDVFWTAPRFNADSSLKMPAYVTVIHNGVLVQNHTEVKGTTQWIGAPSYRKAHGAEPIKLQSHGDKSEPISFRNIWIRNL